MGPALGRWGRYPALQVSDVLLVNEVIYGFGGLLALLLALILYDVLAAKRIYPVTLWGASGFILSLALFIFVVPNTDFARSFVLSLG